MQHQRYILAADGITPVPCDYKTWLAWAEAGGNRPILATEWPVTCVVTTFAGYELSDQGELFETRILGVGADELGKQVLARYHTFWDAIAGHARIVEQLAFTEQLRREELLRRRLAAPEE